MFLSKDETLNPTHNLFKTTFLARINTCFNGLLSLFTIIIINIEFFTYDEAFGGRSYYFIVSKLIL